MISLTNSFDWLYDDYSDNDNDYLTDDKSSSLKASAAVGALLPGVRLLR